MTIVSVRTFITILTVSESYVNRAIRYLLISQLKDAVPKQQDEIIEILYANRLRQNISSSIIRTLLVMSLTFINT